MKANNRMERDALPAAAGTLNGTSRSQRFAGEFSYVIRGNAKI